MIAGIPDPGEHARRVAAVIGFSETETSEPFAAGQLRQIFVALRFTAISIKWGNITSEPCTEAVERTPLSPVQAPASSDHRKYSQARRRRTRRERWVQNSQPPTGEQSVQERLRAGHSLQ